MPWFITVKLTSGPDEASAANITQVCASLSNEYYRGSLKNLIASAKFLISNLCNPIFEVDFLSTKAVRIICIICNFEENFTHKF